MTAEECERKFMTNARMTIGEEQTKEIKDMVLQIEIVENVSELVERLYPASTDR